MTSRSFLASPGRLDAVLAAELAIPRTQAQRAIAGAIGACPAFYRAPHGQHTPFVARVVHQHHMVMVGWDVSVGDWKAQGDTTSPMSWASSRMVFVAHNSPDDEFSTAELPSTTAIWPASTAPPPTSPACWSSDVGKISGRSAGSRPTSSARAGER